MTRYTASAALLLVAWFVSCRSSDPGSSDLPATGSGATSGSGSGAEAGAGTTAEAGAGGSGEVIPEPPSHGDSLVAAKHGYFPTTVTKTDAQNAYDTFHDQYVDDCGANGMR